MGYRDTCVSRSGNACGDAGDNFKIDSGFDQFFGFFAAATEDVRIAAFETGNDFSFLRFLNDEFIDLILRQGMGRRLFYLRKGFRNQLCSNSEILCLPDSRR